MHLPKKKAIKIMEINLKTKGIHNPIWYDLRDFLNQIKKKV